MEMLEMTVLTLNVWGIPFISSDRAVRMEAITTELASGKYDIVSLQEVWSEKDCQLIQEGTALALPYSHYFHSGVMGAGLLVLSKFPIVDTLFHAWSVNGYFHRIQHADWFGGKGVGLCRILIQNRIVNLYTAHLHAEYDIDNDDYKTHRVIQAFDTAQFISATRGKSILQILAGDLNTKPDEVTYNVLLYNSKMEDCCAHETFATNECHHNSYTSRKALERNPAGIRIDHIFMRAAKHVEAQVVDYTLPFPDRVPGHKFSYSDHEAVMARIKLIINPDAASTATSSPRGPVNLVETATSGDNHSAAGDGQCAIDELNPANANGDHPLAAVAAAAFVCSQNSNNVEQQQLGASDSQRLPRHLASLREAISLCERSLQQLNLDRIFYYSIGFFLFCLLIILAEIKLISGLKTLFLIIKLIVFGMILFCIFMGSIWNFMERNGILSGKKSMEIILKHNEKALHMKAN